MTANTKIIRSTCFGFFLGYFALHPFIMIISHLMRMEHMQIAYSFHEILSQQIIYSFSSSMVPWGLAFAVTGAFLGYYRQKNQLNIYALQAARDTLESKVEQRTTELMDESRKLQREKKFLHTVLESLPYLFYVRNVDEIISSTDHHVHWFNSFLTKKGKNKFC